jgi:HlyD family secretion protein
MKRSRLVLLVLAIGIGGAITWQSFQPKPPTQVVTAKVERLPLLRSIVSATGEIRAKEFVDIQAEVEGLIVELLVREGDQVKKGDVLLRLDELQLRAVVDALRAQVGAAEAEAANAIAAIATAEANLAGEKTALANVKVEVEQSRVSRDRARASFRRKEELFQTQLINHEEFEIAAADARLAEQRFNWSEARIQQAEANERAVAARVDSSKAMANAAARRVEAARAQLAGSEDRVGKTIIKAPLTGLITKLNVEKGERAVPGIQSNPISTLMTIADMSVIEAEIRVAEADIVQVALGAAVEVEVDAMRDAKLAGLVTEIGQSPIQTTSGGGNNQNQEGKEFKVVVRLTTPPPALRPGFTATAEIVTATRTNVLVVPFSSRTERSVELDMQGKYVPPPEPVEGAIEVPLSAAERQKQKPVKGVFLLRDGRARFQPVEFGIIGDSMDVEVLSGLNEGDEVISDPYQVLRTLKEWDRVELDPKRTRKPKT